MAPAEFWAMHPSEFHWQAEARKKKSEVQSGRLSEDEADEMRDELRQARIDAGFPPE